MSTRAELRVLIDAAGGLQPPARSTLAELQSTLDDLAAPTGESVTVAVVADGGTTVRPANHPPRCEAGRPLFNNTVCRHCYIRGQLDCDGPT